MFKRFVVYPYKMGSEAGKLIAHTLGALRVFPDREYLPKPGDFIINWGNGNKPKWAWGIDKAAGILNRWDKVDNSINKLDTFNLLKKAGVNTVPWTTSFDKASGWAEADKWVCCRQQIEGKDGEGLVLAKGPGAVMHSPLYTQYVPIAKEFRAYVVRDKLIQVLDKRRDTELLAQGKVNEDVRTESNGWVFCQYGFHPPVGIEKLAIGAIKALGLDFGGVDIVQGKDSKLYVLETNTAPGVGHGTAKLFAEQFKEMVNEL